MKCSSTILALSTVLFSSVTYAQGCADLDPTNPFCMLPLYSDRQANASFDNLPLKSEVTDYEDVEWSGLNVQGNSTGTQLLPHSASHYAFAETGKAVLSTTTDYLYLVGFYFGCGSVNTTSTTEISEACKLVVSGTCLPVGFPAYEGGEVEQLKWTYQYTPHTSHGKTNMSYASPYEGKTTYHGTTMTKHPLLCTNYTLTATTASGNKASLYLDDVEVVLYTEEYY